MVPSDVVLSDARKNVVEFRADEVLGKHVVQEIVGIVNIFPRELSQRFGDIQSILGFLDERRQHNLGVFQKVSLHTFFLTPVTKYLETSSFFLFFIRRGRLLHHSVLVNDVFVCVGEGISGKTCRRAPGAD
jgi:hypothetical protein